GGCLTGRACYLHSKAELAGLLIRRAWAQTIVDGRPHAPWRWADTHPVARLRIPRLGYDQIVLDNATPRTLAFGPARLLSGADFGKPGNLELAGHRTSWFLPLKDIAHGDFLEVEWIDPRLGLRKRTYRVSEVQVLLPEDLRFFTPTTQDALTLVTCYPF